MPAQVITQMRDKKNVCTEYLIARGSCVTREVMGRSTLDGVHCSRARRRQQLKRKLDGGDARLLVASDNSLLGCRELCFALAQRSCTPCGSSTALSKDVLVSQTRAELRQTQRKINRPHTTCAGKSLKGSKKNEQNVARKIGLTCT